MTNGFTSSLDIFPINIQADPRVYRGSVYALLRDQERRYLEREREWRKEREYKVTVIRSRLLYSLPPLLHTNASHIHKDVQRTAYRSVALPPLHHQSIDKSFNKVHFVPKKKLKGKNGETTTVEPSYTRREYRTRYVSSTRPLPFSITPPSTVHHPRFSHVAIQTNDDLDESLEKIVSQLADSAITISLQQLKLETETERFTNYIERNKTDSELKESQLKSALQNAMSVLKGKELTVQELEERLQRRMKSREEAILICRDLTKKSIMKIGRMEDERLDKMSVGIDTRELNRKEDKTISVCRVLAQDNPLLAPYSLSPSSIFGSSLANNKLKLPDIDSEKLGIKKVDTKKVLDDSPLLPSREILEDMLLSLLDATIKSGQIELAKSAFKTQLDVIKKIRPEQYEKYKKMGVESLAAEAVMKQAQMAAMTPRTGNRFIDMLSDNGIPIGSSVKGVEDAIRTQKHLDSSDPSKQIAKAVFEKFQTQILPGIVANLVAGRNPFKVPPRSTPMRQMIPSQLIASHMSQKTPMESLKEEGREIRRSPSRSQPESLYARLSSSPRLSSLLKNPRLRDLLSPSSFSSRLRDSPLDTDTIDSKSALLLGIFDEGMDDDEKAEVEMRRHESSSHPLYTLRSSLLSALASKPEIRRALSHLKVRSDLVDELLRPQQLPFPNNKNAGFIRPRPIPKRQATRV